MPAHGAREFGERGRGRCFAAFDGVETTRKRIEPSMALGGRRATFVGDVVGRPCEAVDRDDRGTVARRDEHGRNGEVFVVADRQATIR
jgi:hypothetical protein